MDAHPIEAAAPPPENIRGEILASPEAAETSLRRSNGGGGKSGHSKAKEDLPAREGKEGEKKTKGSFMKKLVGVFR